MDDSIRRKRAFIETNCWPAWTRRLHKTKVLLLPGIMGSEMRDTQSHETLWVDIEVGKDIRRLGFAKLTPYGGIDRRHKNKEQLVVSERTVKPPAIKKQPYRKLRKNIELATYPFDWRESLPIAARRLAEFLRKAFEGVPADGSYTVLTHSMGGCLLLNLLAEHCEFDGHLGKLIFVAPPFRGALRPIRVVEHGRGAPGDKFINDDKLRAAAGTMPGLFQLGPAPRELWVQRLPSASGEIQLRYPLPEGADHYQLGFWRERGKLRREILGFARSYYEDTLTELDRIAARFADKIEVIVGLNGKNTLSRVVGSPGDWRFRKNGRAKQGKLANGDATVLFQSSFVECFGTEHHWAYVPKQRRNIHQKIMDIGDVITDIKRLRAGHKPRKLKPYAEFIDDIEFGAEQAEQGEPAEPGADLDYLERARLRTTVPYTQWDELGLRGDDGRDPELFHATNAAAQRVLVGGTSLEVEAAGLGVPVEFLADFISDILTPI